tara:strand:- start:1550 stop:1903 length:354 start_codon:yes stop_codon:yes gene_type:complete
MPFDITLAIAKLPLNNGQPDTALLRERYPELRFLFDHLDDARADAEETVPTEQYDEIDEERAKLSDLLTEAIGHLNHVIQMANTIRQMDGSRGVRGPLSGLSKYADDSSANLLALKP